jgi:ABC-type antimicrobial peptide transport system permease subunit
MTERRKVTGWGERFLGRTFGAFAVTALFLACFGVYGLTAHAAAERRREIGIRLAIGATRRDIIRLLVGRGAWLAVVGGLAGLPLAFAASRLVAGLLFQVSPWDPQVWLGLPVTLIAAVLGASFLPARRAGRLDPAVALRQE